MKQIVKHLKGSEYFPYPLYRNTLSVYNTSYLQQRKCKYIFLYGNIYRSDTHGSAHDDNNNNSNLYSAFLTTQRRWIPNIGSKRCISQGADHLLTFISVLPPFDSATWSRGGLFWQPLHLLLSDTTPFDLQLLFCVSWSDDLGPTSRRTREAEERVRGFKSTLEVLLVWSTGIKHEARGPNAARRVILCGPWRLERHMIAFITRAFILKVTN